MRPRQILNTLTIALLASVLIGNSSAFAQVNSRGKPPKGGGGGSSGGTLPSVRYSIDELPFPPITSLVPRAMNNSGMVVGYSRFSDDNIPFVYFEYGVTGSETLYFGDDLDLLAIGYGWALPASFRIRTVLDVNEFGLIVGSMGLDDGTQNQGFAIDTDLSSDPADWAFAALPTLGFSFTAAFNVNDEGDVLGVYRTSGGPLDHYLYNCYDPAVNEPLPLNIPGATIAGMNNDRQVLLEVDNIPTLFEEGESLRIVGDANYVQPFLLASNYLNDAGVFSWKATVNSKGWKTVPIRRSINSGATAETLVNISANVYGLNEQSDVLIEGRRLFHDEVGLVNVDDLILDSDPLKASWVGNGGWIRLLTDRSSNPDDAEFLRFPKMIGTVTTADGYWHAVVLTPGPAPQ